MSASEYYSGAPMATTTTTIPNHPNPSSNPTSRAATPTPSAPQNMPYGADANAPYTYDNHLNVPQQSFQPPSSPNLAANTSYDSYRPASGPQQWPVVAPATDSIPALPAGTEGPNIDGVDGERGLFSSSNGKSSKPEKVAKFIVKQVEKKINKSSGGGGHGQQDYAQYYEDQQQAYGDQYGEAMNAQGGEGGHGWSELLGGSSGQGHGHGWMEQLGLSGGEDGGGDLGGLEGLIC